MNDIFKKKEGFSRRRKKKEGEEKKEGIAYVKRVPRWRTLLYKKKRE